MSHDNTRIASPVKHRSSDKAPPGLGRGTPFPEKGKRSVNEWIRAVITWGNANAGETGAEEKVNDAIKVLNRETSKNVGSETRLEMLERKPKKQSGGKVYSNSTRKSEYSAG
tara:strand:+ start:263 stop:598 length:336 start_codon:yes stop_codon:yes gene_type:complete